MRTLLLTTLLAALPGAPRAEGGAPPAQAEKPAKPRKATAAQGSGGKAAPRPADPKPSPKTDVKEKDGAKGAGAPGEKPCEPVKPCPIDG